MRTFFYFYSPDTMKQPGTDRSHLDAIVSFINGIGIECREGALSGSTFLPGIEIQEGCIVYDPEQLKYPGDLVHEAGHLAIMPPEMRAVANGENMAGDINAAAAEMAAIAWSWAAAQHIQLPPSTLFHEHGYKGESEHLIGNFSNKKYIAVPMLQWLGMTKQPDRDEAPDEHTYPNMIHWLRQKQQGNQ